MLAEQLHDLQAAESHYEQHLALLGNTQQFVETPSPEQAAAHANVMKVYQERAKELGQAGDEEARLHALHKWIQAAERSGDPAALAQAHMQLGLAHQQQGEVYACCNLGVLYYRQRQYDEALTYCERFFEAARGLNDQRVLDVARVNLGAVRAALTFQDYVQVADTDLQTLLLWKNVRMPFKEQNPVTLSVQ
ncbi:hypothetical protein ABBQ38_001290 [Trebouxia sp. C0009 RCD-2024]